MGQIHVHVCALRLFLDLLLDVVLHNQILQFADVIAVGIRGVKHQPTVA